MTALDQLAFACLLNAIWQPVVIVALAAALLRRRRYPPAMAHRIWFAACVFSVGCPLGAVLGLWDHTLPQSASTLAMAALQPYRGLILILAASLASFRLIALARSAVHARRLRGASRPVSPVHFRTGVEFLILPGATQCGPLVAGLFRPAILLPESLFVAGGDSELRAAVAHELAHIERKDPWLLLISELLLAPLAFHPLANQLRRKLAETREMACDERAVRGQLGVREYGNSLLDVAQRSGPRTSAGALGISDGGSLTVRIQALAALDRSGPLRTTRTQALAIVLGGAISSVVLAIAARPAYTMLEAFNLPAPLTQSRVMRIAPPPPPPPPPPAKWR